MEQHKMIIYFKKGEMVTLDGWSSPNFQVAASCDFVVEYNQQTGETNIIKNRHAGNNQFAFSLKAVVDYFNFLYRKYEIPYFYHGIITKVSSESEFNQFFKHII